MAYIAFDLDALNIVPDVAAAAGITPGAVAHGLLKLWAWCFREEVEVVSEVHLKGFFGVDLGPSLEAFGFLARVDLGWRVRGAARYLKIKAAQRDGGRKGRARSSGGVAGRPQVDPGSTPGIPQVDPGSTSGLTRALTPSTEHLILSVPSERIRARPKREKAPDARHAPTIKALTDAGATIDGGRDAANVTALLALATQQVGPDSASAEVVERWRRAVAHEGYPAVRTLQELRTHWGHFAPPPPRHTGSGPIVVTTGGTDW